MNEILAVFGNLYIYRHGIIMAAACAASVCCMAVLAKRKELSPLAAWLSSLFSLIICPVLSRLVYWYCCPAQYSGLGDAMLSVFGGGYSIAGAIPGVILAVFLACLAAGEKRLTDMLDSAAVSGALAIAIGRLAAFFTEADKSRIIFEDSRLCRLPFSVLVTDPATGVQSWRFATFIYEALAGYIIFIILCALLLIGRTEKGSGAMLFCVMFGSSQIVLESTRYDSLFLRSNGFVSLMQIIGLIMLLAGIALLSLRTIKETGFKKLYLWCWLVAFGLLVIAGLLEYFVQRHGNLYAVCYSFMSLCMIGICVISAILLIGEKKASEVNENENV